MNTFSKMTNLKIVHEATLKAKIFRITQFLIGIFFVAFAYNIFIAPNHLVPGGVGGIAIILNYLLGFNKSGIIVILNIILLLLSLKLLGKEKSRASLLGTVIFPIMVILTENMNVWLEIDTSHTLLSTLYGGIIYGLGAGLVFKAGYTTGGTDIINQILSKYLKISLGKSMLISDGLIVLSSGLFFGINHMLYSLIILYCISIISDRVVLGISDSKMFLIITTEEDAVKEYILKQLGHGTTIIKAKGGVNNHNQNVLMTVLPTKSYYQLKEGINRIDSSAFYIIADTYEVFGGE